MTHQSYKIGSVHKTLFANLVTYLDTNMEIFDEPATLMFLHISVELQVLKKFSLFQNSKLITCLNILILKT